MELRIELVVVFVVVVLATLWASRHFAPKAKRFRRHKNRQEPKPRIDRPRIIPFKYDLGDSADQLRHVSNAEFSARKLLSFTEARVFDQVERALAAQDLPWRAMAQVNLGEVLASDDDLAFRAINSKRVDILIVSETHDPIAAVEYQGGGHYDPTAAARDAVKKEALRKAGIGYIEIVEGDHPSEVHNQIDRFIKIEALKSSGKQPRKNSGSMPKKQG
jgi:hypothetical protein